MHYNFSVHDSHRHYFPFYKSRSKVKNDPPEAEALQTRHTGNGSPEDNGIAASPAGTNIEGSSSEQRTRSASGVKKTT